MFTCDELQALILQIIVHDALVVAGHSYSPLLYFTHYSLITLSSHARDIAICIRVLPAQLVRIVRKNVLQSDINGTIRASSEEGSFRELLSTIYLLRIGIVALLLVFI